MYSMAEFDSAVALIHEAAIDPSRWDEALSAMATLFGTDGAHLIFHDAGHASVRSLVWGYPEEANAEYVAYYHQVDPRARLVLESPAGEIVQDHLCFDAAFIRRDEYYQDFLARHDLRHATGSRLDCGEGGTVIYALLSSPRRRPVSERGVALLRRLHGHLQRAARLQNRLQAARQERDDLLSLIDALNEAVFVVADDGRIRCTNLAARKLASRGDGLVVRGARLTAQAPDENARLQSLLSRRPGQGGATPSPYLQVSRRLPSRPLGVTVLQLSERAGPDGRCGAMVWVSDPSCPSAMDAAALSAWYRLTGAECRVAMSLLSGNTLKQSARDLDVSETTVKTHLKSVFAKTGTVRQAELLALLSRAAPPAGDGHH